jgi:hypothetical protein
MGADICFVDEASVRSDAHRGLTWGKIGETPVLEIDRFNLWYGSKQALHRITMPIPHGRRSSSRS